MERIEFYWVVNDMKSEIYLFINMAQTFDDVTGVKSAENLIPDDNFHIYRTFT